MEFQLHAMSNLGALHGGVDQSSLIAQRTLSSAEGETCASQPLSAPEKGHCHLSTHLHMVGLVEKVLCGYGPSVAKP